MVNLIHINHLYKESLPGKCGEEETVPRWNLQPPADLGEPDTHRVGLRDQPQHAGVQVLQRSLQCHRHPGQDVRALPRPD